jgi:hypothetical protein
MATVQAAMPHGDIEEVFTNVFFVTGTSKASFMGMSWQFSRNMVIIRDGGTLTLINTVRLDEEGLAKLDRLGVVEHIVKLGAFHGMDDAFYRARSGARQWALPGMEHEGGHLTDAELVPDGDTPFPNARVFVFETSAQPEGLILAERDGGILISCDSLQNWVEPDRFFSDESAERMKAMGFIQPANIGPGWRMACKPQPSDFSRLKTLTFNHLLPAHGQPLRDRAYDLLYERFKTELGV